MDVQTAMNQLSDVLMSNVSTDLLSNMSAGNRKDAAFQDVMNTTMTRSESKISEKNSQYRTAKTSDMQSVNGKRQQELQTGQETTIAEDDAGSEMTAEVRETLEKNLQDVKEQIADVLDVSPEELEKIMCELGIQMSDLFQLQNIQNLVLTVAGEDSNVALLTNEGLAAQLQDVSGILMELQRGTEVQLELSDGEFSELLQQFEQTESLVQAEASLALDADNSLAPDNMESGTVVDMQPEKMAQTGEKTEPAVDKQAIDSFTAKQEPQKVSVFTEQIPEDGNAMAGQDASNELLLESPGEIFEDASFNVQTEETATQNGMTVNVDTQTAKKTDGILEDAVTSDETANDDLQTAEKVPVATDAEDMLEHRGQKDEKENASPFEHVVNQITQARMNQVSGVSEKAEVVQQMREIVDQVVEQIKVTISADTSEMSMQLNPENLGKVNLSVAVKEGHVTAQFVTETEIARQALETQIQQLRDTLGEQGLKVDKVEVSVSDFSFQQGNEANPEEQKEQQRNTHAKMVQRNLNLADLTELTDLTEEEKLAVDILRVNGNQIDYTA